MIVENTGYIKLGQIEEMINDEKLFSIYKTRKDTMVLVKNSDKSELQLYYPKKDRLPWKILEGKKIGICTRVFTSLEDDFKLFDISTLNNNNQIISYKKYSTF